MGKVSQKPYISYETFSSFEIREFNHLQSICNSTNLLKDLCNELHLECKTQKKMTFIDILLSRQILIQILDSIQEGVQVVDNLGTIKYVNPTFLKILGLQEDERIGKNIFEVSPDGSLATVLKTGQPVTNLKNNPKGTDIQLVSSAVPIYIADNMIGAIAINQDVRDIISLTEQLRKSKLIVNSLSEKIGHLSSAQYTFEDFIGSSVATQNVVDMAKIAAQNDTTVLIQGETGTGKEIIANAIHNASLRAGKPFISVNCSAVPHDLLESEFFGHEKGSFTGAVKRKLGKFELANGGTLFLDEIGDMDLSLQAKILRAIQDKEIQRVGGEKTISLDVRIIAATNRDLKKMAKEGTFRQDLFYRLNVWNINIPPLRERKADLKELTDFLIKKVCRKLGRKTVTINSKAWEILFNYNWPGNVRELENVIERAILSSNNQLNIEADDLKFISINDNSALTDT